MLVLVDGFAILVLVTTKDAKCADEALIDYGEDFWKDRRKR